MCGIVVTCSIENACAQKLSAVHTNEDGVGENTAHNSDLTDSLLKIGRQGRQGGGVVVSEEIERC